MSNFADILNREVRWPKQGDRAFTESDEWQQNARVTKGVHSRLVIMMTGYKKAADLLVEKSQRSGYDRDTLVYPIIFMYRQFIELELKYLVSTYGSRVGVTANWKSHDIAFLWSEFVKVLTAYGVNDPDQTDSVVRSIVAEFAKVDPGSYSYRYPVDIHGREIPLGVEVLNLQALKDVMDGVGAYFTGADGYLDHLDGAGP
ncbi:MAG: hypothetical protein J0G34_10060 [Afipia sp.]|nr:hypothetical protein [Afipia sp.]